MAKQRINEHSEAMERLKAMKLQPEEAKAPAVADPEDQPKKTAPAVKKTERKAPAKKPFKETKSKHLQLLLKPSTFAKLKQASDNSGLSVNEYVNNVLEDILGE